MALKKHTDHVFSPLGLLYSVSQQRTYRKVSLKRPCNSSLAFCLNNLLPSICLLSAWLYLMLCKGMPSTLSLRGSGWGSPEPELSVCQHIIGQKSPLSAVPWLILAMRGQPARGMEGSTIPGLSHTGFGMKWSPLSSACVPQVRDQTPTCSVSVSSPFYHSRTSQRLSTVSPTCF